MSAFRDDVKRLPDPPKRFYVYYMLNSLWFLAVGVGTAFAIYFGLEKSIIGLSGYGCDYTPFLSCFPKELQCNSTRYVFFINILNIYSLEHQTL